MDEADWAKTVATGLPGNLCFGFLSRSEYVPFWCAVLLATLAVYGYGRVKEAKAAAKTATKASKTKQSGKGNGVKADLEDGLLAHAAGNGCAKETRVATEKMAAVCAQVGAGRGLEAASLAVFMTLQHRRRYGTVSAAVLVGGKPRSFDVELASPKMSFREMLLAVDEALQALQNAAAAADGTGETPEVVFAWNVEATAEGQWSVRPCQAGHLTVRGGSHEEELSFQILFEACADSPDGDLWELALVPPASQQQVGIWGSPMRDFKQYRDPATGRLRSVPQVVAELAMDPEADAIAGDGFRISSAELRRRSTAVMRAIKQKADPAMKKAVVVYMGRGEAIGPSFLGVLQAGYTAVPADVHWPAERVRQVAADSEAGLALVEPSSLEAWLALGLAATEAVVVDGAFFAAFGNGATLALPDTPLDQDDPAIVLFTSGSTGRPKGIVLSHGYLTALVVGVGECKRMTKDTRTLCYHSPTWMPFLDYLFAPMIMGGCCLYFPESGTHVVRPNELRAFAQRHNATNAGFVPAMLDILLEEGLPKTMSDIGVGGAAVPAELCHRVVAALPPTAGGEAGVLYTGYSGTEQGDVTQIQMRTVEDVEGGTADQGYMGAGRPHTGQTCAILDRGFRVVGPGGVGEISVAGPGLASGYLQLPEKTAETFLPSLEALGGARTARTGDLGKWTPEGNLKVVGRRDTMVKVRGARIELGEVEAAVSSHPDVKAVVVTVYEDQLVAYVVPAVPATLRDHCKARLVAYMVPHIFEGLEELPRLPNGKINKKALPKPEERTDGAETVMELDSLGQMRKFTRRAASEDRVLDNVRAILIGVVIMSHATPLLPTGMQMLDVASRPLGASWGPMQFYILSITRGGGWSSLAFLNGFDDTRAMRPYGLTYREPLFLILWLILDFNWSMWYLPVFVYMRAIFCAMHWIGLEKMHILLASQIWILMPAFVDLYIGWKPDTPATMGPCPDQCFCLWESFPQGQTLAYYLAGWWVYAKDPAGHSMIGHAIIFIPCYWIGFYTGGSIFKVLTKVADEPNVFKRVSVAALVLGLYCVMYTFGQPLLQGFDDRCSSFWGPSGSLVWMQIARNFVYYFMNLSMSLTYVVFIAAAVPVHLKYLAKNCFPALIMSAYTPCLLDFTAMALQLRQWLPASISPGVEMAWVFTIPFLYELVVGAIFALMVPTIAKTIISMVQNIKGK